MNMLWGALKMTVLLFVLLFIVLGCLAYLALCGFKRWVDCKFNAVFEDWM